MKFESLRVWIKSKDLSVSVYLHFSDTRDFGFKNQITKSCLSISSNIAEGVERSTNRDKSQFLRIAKGSCSEFKAQTIIGIEIGYINQELGKQWLGEAEDIGKMLAGFIRKLEPEMENSD